MDMVTAAKIQIVYEKRLRLSKPLKLKASKMKNRVRNGPVPTETPEIKMPMKTTKLTKAPPSKIL